MDGPHTRAYRKDPAVPPFDDSTPVAFMDGTCALCCLGARMIARFDRADEIRICPTQSALGQAVLRHYRMDPSDPDSWLYVEDGVAYTALDAILRIAERVGYPRWLLWPIARLPQTTRDWIYSRIARNRFWFGRSDICALPDPRLQARLMR